MSCGSKTVMLMGDPSFVTAKYVAVFILLVKLSI